MAMDGNSDTRHRTHSSHSRRTHDHPSGGPRISRLLLGCVDAGFAALIFVVPFIMGGRTASGQLVLVCLTLWIAVCWCLHQFLAGQATWIRSPISLLLVAVLALGGLQLVALPPSLLETLSPHMNEVLPAWTAGAEDTATLGAWTTLSFTPSATQTTLILVLAFGLLLMTTVQRVRRIEDVERLLRWIALSTLAVAGFAIVQSCTSNGKFFWVFEYPHAETSRIVTGCFTNGNHFAQFVALGIGPLIWWAVNGWQSRRRRPTARKHRFRPNAESTDFRTWLQVLLVGCCAFIGLMSLSRGGALAMFLAALVCALILYRGSLLGRGALLGMVGAGLFVGACLCIFGYEMLSSELEDFGSLAELDKGEIRRKLWKADMAGAADYRLVGTGLGSHRHVYSMYLSDQPDWRHKENTHAESGYVQVPLEAGMPGLSLVLIAIGLSVYWCTATLLRSVHARVMACMAAISATLTACFLQSFWDFTWYVPGCMIAPVILGACACRLCQLTRDRARVPVPLGGPLRAAWLFAAGSIVMAGFCMVQDRLGAARAEPYWYNYLLQEKLSRNLEGADRADSLKSMARELSTVVRLQPTHARAHARLAGLYYQLFDNHGSEVDLLGDEARNRSSDYWKGSVDDLRGVVLSSYAPDRPNSFKSSADAMRWASAALGPRYEFLVGVIQHARQAVALCPLQGEAYLPLIQFAFLDGPQAEMPARAAYIEQALAVRPFHGDVLCIAGVVAQDRVKAMQESEEALKTAFLTGEINQAELSSRANQLRAELRNDRSLIEEAQKRSNDYWKASFASGPVSQRQLLDILAGELPVTQLLGLFEPDLAALKVMYAHYKKAGLPDETRIVESHLAGAFEEHAATLKGKEAADSWTSAADHYQNVDMLEQTFRCLSRAMHCDSTHFRTRLVLGECFLKARDFDQARKHLEWCSRRRPQDERLRKLTDAAIDGGLRHSSVPDELRATGSRPR